MLAWDHHTEVSVPAPAPLRDPYVVAAFLGRGLRLLPDHAVWAVRIPERFVMSGHARHARSRTLDNPPAIHDRPLDCSDGLAGETQAPFSRNATTWRRIALLLARCEALQRRSDGLMASLARFQVRSLAANRRLAELKQPRVSPTRSA